MLAFSNAGDGYIMRLYIRLHDWRTVFAGWWGLWWIRCTISSVVALIPLFRFFELILTGVTSEFIPEYSNYMLKMHFHQWQTTPALLLLLSDWRHLCCQSVGLLTFPLSLRTVDLPFELVLPVGHFAASHWSLVDWNSCTANLSCITNSWRSNIIAWKSEDTERRR